MRKPFTIAAGLAAMATTAALALTACGGSSPGTSGTSTPASPPSASSYLAASKYDNIAPNTVPPGMTQEGVTSSAIGLGGGNGVVTEEVVTAYDTAAHAEAGLLYFEGQASSIGMDPTPVTSPDTFTLNTSPLGELYRTGTLVVAFGSPSEMSQLVSQSFGANPASTPTAPPSPSPSYVEPAWYPSWSPQPFSGYTANAMPDVPGAVAWTVVSCGEYQCTSFPGAGPDGSTCGPVINNGTSQICATRANPAGS